MSGGSLGTPCPKDGTLSNVVTRLHRRKVVWFVDNTSALFAAMRGSSRNVIVSRAVAAAAFLCFHFNCNIWHEFVDSESNWSDGLSRKGAADDFVSRHNFAVSEMRTPTAIWKGSLLEIWRTLEQQRWGSVSRQ